MAPTPRKTTTKPPSSDQGVTEASESAGTFTPVEEPFARLSGQAAETSIAKAAEISERARKLAERGIEQTRTVYDRLRTVTEEATGSFESSYAAAAKGLQDFNTKAIDAMKSNADATFDFMKAMMSVKTVSEAITLQTEHARKQFEAMAAQTRELAEIASKAATETTEPLKTNVVKTFGKAA